MTKKDYIVIARAISHSTRALNLDNRDMEELVTTFAFALAQKDKKFNHSKFREAIDRFTNEMYQEWLEDQAK